MTAWRDRPKPDRYAVVGCFIGMGIAATVAFHFAFYAGTAVRWAIMATGLVAGWGVGRYLGSRA
jgi:hypothetical protein